MPDELVAMVVVPALFATIGFVVWTIVNGSQRRQQLKTVAEFNSRLLDRVGTMKDFAEFLQTDGGAKCMNSLTAERRPTGPSDRILFATQVGIVLASLGIGFLSLDSYLGLDDAVGFTILGVVALSIGIGFLVSSGVSYWLAKALGVIQVGDQRRDVREAR